MTRVRSQRLSDHPASDDGLRVLVTTCWPRGVPRTTGDVWYRRRVTPPDRLRAWPAGTMAPPTSPPAAAGARPTAAQREQRQVRDAVGRGPVNLLTSCRGLDRWHLPLLAAELARQP